MLHLRDYGYSTKACFDDRMDAIDFAIQYNSVEAVYERLVKLSEYNPIMKEDADDLELIYDSINLGKSEEEIKDQTLWFTRGVFKKILDVKMEYYKKEFSRLLDGANVDNVFEILRENIIDVYNEKLLQQ